MHRYAALRGLHEVREHRGEEDQGLRIQDADREPLTDDLSRVWPLRFALGHGSRVLLTVAKGVKPEPTEITPAHQLQDG